MKKLCLALVYTALAAVANTGFAAGALDTAAAGAVRGLIVHEAPKPVPDTPFLRGDGSEGSLADYRGKYALVNFWATWCAPCREEMPMLAGLQEAYGGDRFEVVTISAGRDSDAKIARFFDEIGISSLPRHRDTKMALARGMQVLGLPVVVLIGPEGNELARLTGPYDWSSPEAAALVESLTAAVN